MTPMPTELMIELRDIFATLFDEEGLTDFALALGIDYQNLSGSNKSAKARELSLYLWRHSKLPKLAEVGPKQRLDIDWAKVLNAYLPAVSEGDDVIITGTKLSHTDLQKLVPILAAYPLFQTPDSRNTALVLAGVNTLVNQDLNGPAQYVASSLLVKLNDYGEISKGDLAIGRLLAYVASDPALPPSHKAVIESIGVKYGIALG